MDTAHDAGAAGVLGSVDALQDTRAVDRILVCTRGPHVIADQPGDAPRPRVRDVITTERTRPWTTREVAEFTTRADRIAADLPRGHEHRALLAHLVTAARRRGPEQHRPGSRSAPTAGAPPTRARTTRTPNTR